MVEDYIILDVMGNKKKILFVGLDNSEKTSIIRFFQQRYSIFQTQPTLGLERSELLSTEWLGLDFMSWDLGGQKKYRDSYFQQKYYIFVNTTAVFYILDIQDHMRIGESLKYLQSIFDIYIELKENPRFLICFHKIDPQISDVLPIMERITKIRGQIDSMNKRVFSDFFSTSIQNPGSLIRAFSYGIIRESPKADLFSSQLKEYVKATFSSAVILFDSDILMISSHATKKEYIELCEVVSPRFVIAIVAMEKSGLKSENIMINLNHGANKGILPFF